MPSDADQLIAQGKLAEAADLLLRQGEPARAAELYEQIWDYTSAAQAALAANDPARALEDAVRAQDQGMEEEALERLRETAAGADGEALLRRAARTCETRGAWARAAQLHRMTGDLFQVSRCLDEAGMLLEAGRALEEQGRVKDAVDRYRRFLFQVEDGDAEAGPEATLCRLLLGRSLLRHGRHDEALPHLQRAWLTGSGPDARQAGKTAVAGLHYLGYGHAVEEALRLLNARLAPGEMTISLEQCLQDPEVAVQEGEVEARVLAGRYRLGELLGQGGMGSVYEAVDLLPSRQEKVAVKVFTTPAGTRGRDAFLRFVREARAMGELRHPHVVTLIDFNEDLGFLVLEHMSGGTLAHRLLHPLPLPACQEVMLQLLSGLAAAHQRGIIHRDIKPSNIFFNAAGAVKLGDFGVAHLQDSGQTQTGAFIGTLAFMSPEQITGADLTFACDMYALGVLLHRMVTGRLPFNPPDLVGKHLSANPPSPSSVHPGLPEAYDEVVLRCLAKRPEDRYSSLADLRRAVMELPVGPEVDDPAQPGPVSSQEGDRERRGSGQRYRMHGPLAGEAGSVQLIHAEDLHLGREVQLVRTPPGPERERVMTLVQAAAAVPPEGGRQHLQVVLDLDEERGWAVLVPTPPPRLPAPESRRERLELCHQIALALAPLHRAGASHGEVAKEGSIAMAGGQFILLLGPALVAQGVSPPGQDLQDLALLCGLEDLPHDVDSDVLGGWAAEQLSVLMDMELQEQRERLLRQAAASAEEF